MRRTGHLFSSKPLLPTPHVIWKTRSLKTPSSRRRVLSALPTPTLYTNRNPSPRKTEDSPRTLDLHREDLTWRLAAKHRNVSDRRHLPVTGRRCVVVPPRRKPGHRKESSSTYVQRSGTEKEEYQSFETQGSSPWPSSNVGRGRGDGPSVFMM